MAADVTAAPTMTALRVQRLATVLALFSILEATSIVLLGRAGGSAFEIAVDLTTIGFLGAIVAFPVVGALIIQRRPFTRVAWLMIALGIGLGLGLVAFGYGVLGQGPNPPPGATAALVLSQLFFVPSVGLATSLILLLFPSDRFIGPRWRIVAVLGALGTLMFDLGTLLHPGDFDPNVLPGVRNPLGAPPELADALDLIVTVGNTIVVTAVLLAGASLVIRYRRADPVEAAQIRWIAVVGITATVLLGFSAFQLGPITDLAFDLGLVALACLPIAIGIAITRYRLYDIDRLINRTLVYGSLTAILAGVFTAAVGGAQRIFIAMTGETSDGAIVATTLVVATLYAPLRKRLEAIVDRRFKYEQSTFGSYRDELLRTISLIDADAAAQRLAREVARETGALGVAVLGRSGEPSASSGLWPVEGAVELEIEGGHGEIARLVVGPRPGGVVVEPARLAAAQSLAALAARAIREADAR